METIAEKNFTLNLREFVYALTLAVALLGQWYSNKAALNEAVLNLKAEQSLLRLEVTVLKAQIEEIKRAKQKQLDEVALKIFTNFVSKL